MAPKRKANAAAAPASANSPGQALGECLARVAECKAENEKLRARINELLSAETIEVPTSTGKEGAAALVQIFEAVTECTMSNIARRADIASAEVAAPSANPKRKKSTQPVDLGT